MKYKVIITIENCTDLEGKPVKAVLRLEADSIESAKKEGLKMFKESLPAKAEAIEDELPYYE